MTYPAGVTEEDIASGARAVLRTVALRLAEAVGPLAAAEAILELAILIANMPITEQTNRCPNGED